jgi:branched-subunit amino acid aminotransferase/4-amino-4-deoxychorismate lyase
VAIYSEEVADFIRRNGEIIPWAEATVHVNAVGHASVAGIFEGIKAYWKEEREQLYVFRLEEHLERFLNSIRMVRYGCECAREELHRAEEIFFVGTGWEIMPVDSVDRLPVGSWQTGPLTLRIAEACRRVVTGQDDGHPEWRAPVWKGRP